MRYFHLFFISAAALLAHPMGNFSVNHYAKLRPSASGVELQYVLDLAEIPTFELLRDWNIDRLAPPAELDRRAATQARVWLNNLDIAIDGAAVHPKFESTKIVIADGAGNLPILRINTRARIDARGGKLTYEDRNYPERAGWKEIVVGRGTGVTLRQASHSNLDISKGLTQYPADPTLAPPQDLRAEMTWTVAEPLLAAAKPPAQTVIQQIAQPRTAPPAPAPATLTAKAAPAGAVTRGDFLSRFLHERQLTPWMILVALGAAFALGAAHAFTPGHGKTIVAAYLVGSRGTLKHAAFLGAMVTFTHTIVVFALGLATLFLFKYIVPEKITEILGAISGLSIAMIGGWMLYKRIRGRAPAHTHHHHHDHDHHHDHHHDHDHGGHSHSHVPEEISWKGLVALGASGGLVPCESALVLLLGAIALGRVGLGLLLLLSFSIGLAIVLMAIGILVLYAKNLIPESKRASNHPLVRWASIASPAIVLIVGIVMTGVSLGWIQPKWMIG
jgi:ABC-type nickel/cobalt efflux system permease component RcnA